jgi:hypothetical protein
MLAPGLGAALLVCGQALAVVVIFVRTLVRVTASAEASVSRAADSSEALVLWHTDDIYANDGEPPFPLDPGTNKLAAPDVAARLYFKQRWVDPGTLVKAGFLYKLERVFPNQGLGVSARGIYEDRAEYGLTIGYWNRKGGQNSRRSSGCPSTTHSAANSC